LICEVSEDQIRHEAVDFTSANSKELGADWVIDILIPAGAALVCMSEPVTTFVEQR